MFNKLKQFKDLRSRAKEIQGVLGKESAQGSAGWGKVKVDITGNQQVTAVTIEPDVMNDRAKLQDLVKDAVNDAIQKIQKIMASKMKDSGGMDLAQEFGEMMKK